MPAYLRLQASLLASLLFALAACPAEPSAAVVIEVHAETFLRDSVGDVSISLTVRNVGGAEAELPGCSGLTFWPVWRVGDPEPGTPTFACAPPTPTFTPLSPGASFTTLARMHLDPGSYRLSVLYMQHGQQVQRAPWSTVFQVL